MLQLNECEFYILNSNALLCSKPRPSGHRVHFGVWFRLINPTIWPKYTESDTCTCPSRKERPRYQFLTSLIRPGKMLCISTSFETCRLNCHNYRLSSNDTPTSSGCSTVDLPSVYSVLLVTNNHFPTRKLRKWLMPNNKSSLPGLMSYK